MSYIVQYFIEFEDSLNEDYFDGDICEWAKGYYKPPSIVVAETLEELECTLENK